jgi:hypothetical protein
MTDRKKNLRARERREAHAPVTSLLSNPRAASMASAPYAVKMAGRRFGLVAVDAHEDRFSPLEISNLVADEFRELRDEIIAERAARGAEGSRP